MPDAKQLRVLIDTNVWLDFFLSRRPNCDATERLIRRCAHDDVASLYPSRSIMDVFYQVGLAYKKRIRKDGIELNDAWAHAINDQAWECVRTMRELAVVVGMDESDLWLAYKLRDLHPDLEDDLVLAAAERAQADFLVTNDQQLIAKSTVAALTPQDMLAVFSARDA